MARRVFGPRAAGRRAGRGGALAALIAGALALALIPRPVAATQNPASVCLAAADAAGDAHGVPRAVMRALTRTETGRARGGALQPWPWTVNMEGAGHWFDGRAEALDFVERARARGARSFDIGCFQVNHLWHGENFASVAEMFDPAANADYAARFMAELYRETRSWPAAAGFYHSRTPEFTARYRARFERILADGDPDAPLAFAAADPAAPPEDALPGKPARPKPLLWRAAEAVTPPSAGAVPVRLLRGGLSLVAARGQPRPLIGAP